MYSLLTSKSKHLTHLMQTLIKFLIKKEELDTFVEELDTALS